MERWVLFQFLKKKKTFYLSGCQSGAHIGAK